MSAMQNSAHNIWESFRQGVNHHPHQIACHFKEEAVFKHFSYEELYQRTLQFAFVLKESGVQAREHVAILAENHPDFVIAFFAVMA